ncbi:RICIN domain-containing protein [Amycolatopsis sp. CA-230715]|uniref:RICIN domain-containing protein n=1 Tax=Amycolatopsis sp. CA-230715 TaxID=2745196 RepID=UPI001C0156EF|nr:RICIN domain-containing protein [Amycolatopsis sp. CA-230715]QWF84710.1 hypothetical protein HUW46_08162 [Amycolatopsis sp. CA-230715]
MGEKKSGARGLLRGAAVLAAGAGAAVLLAGASVAAAETVPQDELTTAAAGWGGTYEWSPGNAPGSRLDLAQRANRVDIWRANNGSNQLWRTYSYGGGVYAFQNRANGKCLWYAGNDAQLTTGNCDDSNSHKFKGVKHSGGYWTFNPINQRSGCLDVRGRGTGNGTYVVTHACNGDSNQRWYSHH